VYVCGCLNFLCFWFDLMIWCALCVLWMCSTSFQVLSVFDIYAYRSKLSKLTSCSCLMFLVISLCYLCMSLILHKIIIFTLIHTFALGFFNLFIKHIKDSNRKHFLFLLLFLLNVKISVFIFIIYTWYLGKYPKIELQMLLLNITTYFRANEFIEVII
jgi:hypothetical protein